MRVTEQIDALEIMGINSASFLILPKIISTVLFFPVLIILSICIGLLGGWIGCQTSGITTADFLFGIKLDFNPFYVTYCLIKITVFAFIVSSVSSYFGYYTKGGALDVGRSSTKAVVYSSIIVLIFNFIFNRSSTSMIEIQNITKSFGENEVLKNISFTFEEEKQI